MADPYERHRAVVKANGFMVTPYRLGLAVGKAGENLPCPYPHQKSRLSGFPC